MKALADVLIKPGRDDYENPKHRKKRNIADAETAAASTNKTTQSANVLEANVFQYKLDVEEWKDNDKSFPIAEIPLLLCVYPTICRKLEGYDDPKDAWGFLKGQYKMPNACALAIV